MESITTRLALLVLERVTDLDTVCYNHDMELHHVLRSLLVVLVSLAVVPASASGSGWNDYSLRIDDKYEIVRCNTMDIGLCSGGRFIVIPRPSNPIGPIFGYSVTPSHIFTRHYGRKPRNLSPRDTLELVDRSKVYYCIVRKADDSVSGPMDATAFWSQPDVRSAGDLSWTTPSNPNPVAVRDVSLMLLALWLLVVVGPILLVVALLVVIGWLVIRGRSRRLAT